MKMHWGWAYDGVNGSIPRNTGPECVNYLSTTRHIVESIIMVPVAIIILKYGMSKLPTLQMNYNVTDRIIFGKQLLLIMMTFLLGLEMGFKLCTRTAIYILNPCHVTSMLQVYLLAAKPSKWTTTLFRIHINYLNGPLLAFLFPEHDSRKITFELPTYYIQHGLMFIIPIYLLRLGGPYAAEKIADFSYSITAYGIFIFYHFGFLEFFAVSAQVNLNHMICPAILDPFQGASYRLVACMHQMLLCPLISKVFGCVFSSTQRSEDGIMSTQISSPPGDSRRISLQKTSSAQHGFEHIRQAQNTDYNILDNLCNASVCMNTRQLPAKTMQQSNAKKQIGNGCDIDNSLPGNASIPNSNNSNKKIQ